MRIGFFVPLVAILLLPLSASASLTDVLAVETSPAIEPVPVGEPLTLEPFSASADVEEEVTNQIPNIVPVVYYTAEMVVDALAEDFKGSGCGVFKWAPQDKPVVVATGNAKGVIETVNENTAVFEGCITQDEWAL